MELSYLKSSISLRPKGLISLGNVLLKKERYPKPRLYITNIASLSKCLKCKEPSWITSDHSICSQYSIWICISRMWWLQNKRSVSEGIWLESVLPCSITYRWTVGSVCFIKFSESIFSSDSHPNLIRLILLLLHKKGRHWVIFPKDIYKDPTICLRAKE